MKREIPCGELHQLIIQFSVRAANRESILENLRHIEGPTRVQRGCRQMSVYLKTDNTDEIMMIQEWETAAAMRAHFHSKEFRVLLSVIDLSEQEPGIRINTGTSREGVEHFRNMLDEQQ